MTATKQSKPTVGQTVFMLNVGNNARNEAPKLRPAVVKSVGRKYFTVGEADWSEWRDVKFRLSDWCEETRYSSNWALYESEKEWADETEHRALWAQLQNLARTFKCPFSLEKLRDIFAIINQ